jgi:hypothetical protein
MENFEALIQLDSLDNVLVARRTLAKGDVVNISGQNFTLERGLALGFKIANQDIGKGEKIIKCGVSIGSASRDIDLGEEVHLHNMQSDYVPTYTIQNPKSI